MIKIIKREIEPQPEGISTETIFRYKNEIGIFRDNSVFGISSHSIRIKDKFAFWGAAHSKSEWISDFTDEDSDIIKEALKTLKINIPTREQCEAYYVEDEY